MSKKKHHKSSRSDSESRSLSSQSSIDGRKSKKSKRKKSKSSKSCKKSKSKQPEVLNTQPQAQIESHRQAPSDTYLSIEQNPAKKSLKNDENPVKTRSESSRSKPQPNSSSKRSRSRTRSRSRSHSVRQSSRDRYRRFRRSSSHSKRHRNESTRPTEPTSERSFGDPPRPHHTPTREPSEMTVMSDTQKLYSDPYNCNSSRNLVSLTDTSVNTVFYYEENSDYCRQRRFPSYHQYQQPYFNFNQYQHSFSGGHNMSNLKQLTRIPNASLYERSFGNAECQLHEAPGKIQHEEIDYEAESDVDSELNNDENCEARNEHKHNGEIESARVDILDLEWDLLQKKSNGIEPNAAGYETKLNVRRQRDLVDRMGLLARYLDESSVQSMIQKVHCADELVVNNLRTFNALLHHDEKKKINFREMQRNAIFARYDLDNRKKLLFSSDTRLLSDFLNISRASASRFKTLSSSQISRLPSPSFSNLSSLESTSPSLSAAANSCNHHASVSLSSSLSTASNSSCEASASSQSSSILCSSGTESKQINNLYQQCIDFFKEESVNLDKPNIIVC